MTAVNFLAKMGGDGMLAPFILGRKGGNQQVLGTVQVFTSFGVMTGSFLAALMKPVKGKLKLIHPATAVVFSGK